MSFLPQYSPCSSSIGRRQDGSVHLSNVDCSLVSGVSRTQSLNSSQTSNGSLASSLPGFLVPGVFNPQLTFPFQDVSHLPHVPQPGEHREYSSHSHPSPAMGRITNNLTPQETNHGLGQHSLTGLSHGLSNLSGPGPNLVQANVQVAGLPVASPQGVLGPVHAPIPGPPLVQDSGNITPSYFQVPGNGSGASSSYGNYVSSHLVTLLAISHHLVQHAVYLSSTMVDIAQVAELERMEGEMDFMVTSLLPFWATAHRIEVTDTINSLRSAQTIMEDNLIRFLNGLSHAHARLLITIPSPQEPGSHPSRCQSPSPVPGPQSSPPLPPTVHSSHIPQSVGSSKYFSHPPPPPAMEEDPINPRSQETNHGLGQHSLAGPSHGLVNLSGPGPNLVQANVQAAGLPVVSPQGVLDPVHAPNPGPPLVQDSGNIIPGSPHQVISHHGVPYGNVGSFQTIGARSKGACSKGACSNRAPQFSQNNQPKLIIEEPLYSFSNCSHRELSNFATFSSINQIKNIIFFMLVSHIYSILCFLLTVPSKFKTMSNFFDIHCKLKT